MVSQIEHFVAYSALSQYQNHWCQWDLKFNTLRPRQNGRRFADDTFKPIFLNENIIISIKISLKFVPKGFNKIQLENWLLNLEFCWNQATENYKLKCKTGVSMFDREFHWKTVSSIFCWSFNSLGPSDAIWWQEIWVNTGSGNGLLPDGTKPLPEPMLTNDQSGIVAFIW